MSTRGGARRKDAHRARLLLAFADAYPIFKMVPSLRFSAKDARGLMEEYVAAPRNEKFPPALVEFARIGFRRYLNGEAKTLDAAFRLKSRGRTKSKRIYERRLLLAQEVLIRMRKGETRDAAVANISRDRRVSFDYVLDAYSDLKFWAGLLLKRGKIARAFVDQRGKK